MTTKKRKGRKRKYYDWAVYPDLYFASALHLCNLLSKGTAETTINESNFCKSIGSKSAHSDCFAIYPIVFNLKHGIELYLKGLGNISHGEYLINHDLRCLFDYLIGDAGKKNKLILQRLKNETWPVIKKYYYGTYCGKNKTEGLPDCMNEAERYPETKNAYDVSDSFEWVTYDLIAEIEKDIILLEKKFAQAKRNLK